MIVDERKISRSEFGWPRDKLFVWVTFGKAPMIAFDTHDASLVWPFNLAIKEAGKEHNWHLFHQIGASNSGENDIGFHGWETWAGITAEEFERWLPEIEKRAIEVWIANSDSHSHRQ